ncbi:MAG: alkaline phosphatase family protein, partial [Candidatus Krumholzibacteria bacterium]|nr:alkaline phosphatase family protein [Candidatus Krumholzibacteria bacterium]
MARALPSALDRDERADAHSGHAMRLGLPHTLPLLLAALTLFGACGGGERDAAPAGEPARTVRHGSWDDFLAARAGAGARRQVVVIGLDAAPWFYVDRLIAEGRMPNLARVVREGARATLRSVDTQVTPPAWTSIFTGYAPERTGVYTFGYWNAETEAFRSANSADVAVPFVWEAASRAGLEVAVVNVPMTYPVRAVNGVMVSGMMTPVEILPPLSARALRVPAAWYRDAPGTKDFAPPVRAAAGDSLNGFLWRFHDTADDGRRRYDTVALRVLAHEASGETRELAFYVGRNGAYTPWLPVRARVDGRTVDAWTRAYLEASDEGAFTFRLSRTVLPIDVPFTHPPALAQDLNKRFGFYLPSKHLDTE